jgi:hypothetical protein
MMSNPHDPRSWQQPQPYPRSPAQPPQPYPQSTPYPQYQAYPQAQPQAPSPYPHSYPQTPAAADADPQLSLAPWAADPKSSRRWSFALRPLFFLVVNPVAIAMAVWMHHWLIVVTVVIALLIANCFEQVSRMIAAQQRKGHELVEQMAEDLPSD